jgi:hypothetical protein
MICKFILSKSKKFIVQPKFMKEEVFKYRMRTVGKVVN